MRKRVRDYLAERRRVPSIDSSLKRLASVGFQPKGVYDVGAYRGDFAEEVLKIWPQTRVTCFEPQASRAEDLDALSCRHPNQIDYQACLLGAALQAAVTFHVGDTASSVLAHSAGEQYPTVELPMTTIDEFRSTGKRSPCCLLKLDVQGYELDVLRGAASTLRSEVRVILAELNFLDIYASVPLMHETVAWLAEHDLVAYDICSLIRRPLDEALWQADFLFVRTDGELRRNKLWGKS